MLWCAVICLIIGAMLGYVVAALMVAAKEDQRMPVKHAYTMNEIRDICHANESRTMHIWIKDCFGVFPSIAGIVHDRMGNEIIEAAYSLEESVYFGEKDYGEIWLAFPTKKAAEDFPWSFD